MKTQDEKDADRKQWLIESLADYHGQILAMLETISLYQDRSIAMTKELESLNEKHT